MVVGMVVLTASSRVFHESAQRADGSRIMDSEILVGDPLPFQTYSQTSRVMDDTAAKPLDGAPCLNRPSSGLCVLKPCGQSLEKPNPVWYCVSDVIYCTDVEKKKKSLWIFPRLKWKYTQHSVFGE